MPNIVENICFSFDSNIIDSRTKNLTSIKTLEANGFKCFKNVIDAKGRDEYMIVLEIEN